MSQTYTYQFIGTDYGTITVTAADSITTGVPGAAAGSAGYAATSISGTWDSLTIDHMFGPAGQVTNQNVGAWNFYYANTIFTSGGFDGLGYPGNTLGIDNAGLMFTTTDGVSPGDGPVVNIYTQSGSWNYALSTGPQGSLTLASGPCFVSATNILAASGEVAVEDLRVGDLVVTHSGERPALKPIRWIGRRSYAGRFAAGKKDILPILFRAGALADGVPHRDLYVSPRHAMFLDGVLIPAAELVNGVSVVQLETVDVVTYYHIELDEHDVIVAEGARSESFVDDDSRGLFQNAHEYYARYPDARPAPARYCAPRLEGGFEVEAVRRRIDLRAGIRCADDRQTPAPLKGWLDHVGPDGIRGWAQNAKHAEVAVCLDIFDNGTLIARTLANRFREDLKNAGLGSGRHSFDVRLPISLCPRTRHVIDVRRSSDGAPLAKSPTIIEPSLHDDTDGRIAA